MAWTAPMTFVNNSVLTAAQLNIYLRDNMLETAVARAVSAGGYFVSTGPGSIIQRKVMQAATDTSLAVTSEGFEAQENTTAPGPTVTMDTGTSALVWIGASVSTAAAAIARMTCNVSGATSISGDDSRSWSVQFGSGSRFAMGGTAIWYNVLVPGSNTFTAEYRTSTSTATFTARRIIVYPY
jgi:hypothetical protein